MNPLVRKRVTRVGSGAFSIYIPKKWVDSWTPQQQQEREVDLRFISGGLLIAPVHQATQYEAALESNAQQVCTRLLSAYVRGYTEANLAPVEAFDNDVIAAARDFLRHLDERLVAKCSAERIGFTLRPDLPPPATTGLDLLAVLGARVREAVRLAGDAVHSYGHDPDRTLHALRLLRDTHEEDVSRLYFQVLRLVATLEIPMDSVSDYQLLGMAAAGLHQLSAQAEAIGAIILQDYKLEPQLLLYPRDHLLATMTKPPVQTGVARALVRTHHKAIERLLLHLDELMQALADQDVVALSAVAGAVPKEQAAMQEGVFQAVAQNWGHAPSAETAMAAFTASKISSPLAACFNHIEAVARSSTALLAARPA